MAWDLRRCPDKHKVDACLTLTMNASFSLLPVPHSSHPNPGPAYSNPVRSRSLTPFFTDEETVAFEDEYLASLEPRQRVHPSLSLDSVNLHQCLSRRLI